MLVQHDCLTSADITEIFAGKARKLFGDLLSLLCQEANISQRRLGREAVAFRKSLIEQGYTYVSGYKVGTVGQSGISRVINGLVDVNYVQIYIWLRILREIFKSKEYLQYCKENGVEPYLFDDNFETDMWRLALFGRPREVIETYERRKDMFKAK